MVNLFYSEKGKRTYARTQHFKVFINEKLHQACDIGKQGILTF